MRPEHYQKHAATLARVAALCHADLRIVQNDNYSHVTLHRPGGTTLYISHHYQDRTGDRLTISPAWDTGRIHENGHPILEMERGESITLNFSRSPAALAADLTRRIWPRARAWSTQRHAAAAAASLANATRETRLDQLREILGANDSWTGRSDYVRIGPLKLCTHRLTENTPTNAFTMEIDAHSWPAVLMIARILAAEKELHPPTN